MSEGNLFALLSEAPLHWLEGAPPVGGLVGVHDTLRSDGSFMLHHLIALFVRGGHRVCVVASAQAPEHYLAVARKLGCPLDAAVAGGRCILVDALTAPLPEHDLVGPAAAPDRSPAAAAAECSVGRASRRLRSLVRRLAAFATAGGGAGSVPAAATLLVVDDLCALQAAASATAGEMLDFVHYCRVLASGCGSAVCCALLLHSDAEEPDTAMLRPCLLDVCAVTFVVEALPTGVSRDVHGLLTIHQHHAGTRRLRTRTATEGAARQQEAGATESALPVVSARFKTLEGSVRVSRA